MIHAIYSDLPSFKMLQFRRGLNIVLSEKSEGATDKQTRNRTGKSSFVETIHFVMGADCPPRSIHRHSRLDDCYFGVCFDLGGQRVDVRRSGARPGIVTIVQGATEYWPKQPDATLINDRDMTIKKWRINLAALVYNLSVAESAEGEGIGEENEESDQIAKPVALTFRSLYPYFVRRVESGGFYDPFRITTKQSTATTQMAVMFLLGLDWTIAQDWEQTRRREKIVKAMARSGHRPPIPDIPSKTADLRAWLTIQQNKASRLSETVRNFQALEEYPDLQRESAELAGDIGSLSDANTMDRRLINELRSATEAEAPPTYDKLRDLYEESGIVLPDSVLRRFDDVVRFHEAVIGNRRSYLRSEIEDAERRVRDRDEIIRHRERRKTEVLSILQAYGALDQLVQLNAELSRIQVNTEAVRAYLSRHETTEKEKTEISIERAKLSLRLQQDYTEQAQTMARAVSIFEEISSALYEDGTQGFLSLGDTPNGPTFEITIHGGRSEGIKSMQIFCFDMMLMRLCSERGIGPGHLIHDSHLFDGVDARQTAKALMLGAELSERYGFQYIVTLNSDQIAEREWFRPEFSVENYILSPCLTDKTEDGGLFGLRFA